MAFKGGSPIQAGLGAANFSPILAGGQAMGNAYANVGATLASAGMQAVQTYRQKQQEKAQKEAATSYLMKNMNMTPEDAKAFVGGVGAQNMPAFITQMELTKLKQMQQLNQARDFAGISQVLNNSAMAKENPEDPTYYNLNDAISMAEEMNLSNDAIQEIRQQIADLNELAKSKEPNTGLEDRTEYINMNPDSPYYGETRIFGAKNEGGEFVSIIDGETHQLTRDWEPVSALEARSPGKAVFEKKRDALAQEIAGAEKLRKYADSRMAAGTGVEYLKNRITGMFKTILGSKQRLTPDELAAGEAQKRLSSAIGAFRNEVVGPGIVTEFDAKRIEDALGGALTTGNPEVVQRLVDDIMKEKETKIQRLSTELKEQRASDPRLAGAVWNIPEYSANIPSFNSEAEAEAAGLQPGQRVIINGREYIYQE